MEHLRNTWYVAMWGDDLSADQLVSRMICEQPIVFYRKLDGSVAAIEDQCAHRFAPLSQGRLCGDEVQCPYHGLRYDSNGMCVGNPHGAGRITPALHLSSFTVEVRHTLVWVWIGSEPADASLIPDFSYLDEGAPGVVSKRDHMVLDVDYRLMVDNLLDLSHVNFLHEGLLGHSGMVDAETEIREEGTTLFVTRTSRDVAPSKLFDLMHRNDGEPVDTWAEMRWDAPASLRNHAGVCPPGAEREEGMTVIGTHILTPIDSHHCMYHIAAVQLGGLPPEETEAGVAEQLTRLRRFAFEEQDRPMVEAQQRAYDRAGGPDALRPVMLSIDAGPLRARRMLQHLIDEAAPRPEQVAV
jgi:phenylpropionate dioxygenase-like ring-hydroxylating dioxygenase large terminal subunit